MEMRNSIFILLCCFMPPAMAVQWCYEDAQGIMYVEQQRTSNKGRRCAIAKNDAVQRWQATKANSAIRISRTSPRRRFTALVANGRYDKVIGHFARRYGVDPYFVKAVMAVESGFNPDIISAKGAVGLMQLMPETANRLSSALGYSLEKHRLSDPELNIHLGTYLLSELTKRYSSNLELVLAAYNAGEGNVAKYSNQIPPFNETHKYIKNVIREYKTIH
ncbi:lytic transglycosylase domain-containing protein [Citrobacter sp. Igbk 16]|uniref:lytic transglycosylase domain-containing protein n=1 Tax=Citrobacter sp. Igbk 16 TaxID=2963958 RepID=UPI00230495B5|nr:lytic transglycosylase domain-containing protein [Citrobacter sp. Igbk 16]MDA8516266.1 lytic transglycosylase domain-containing protein [Citrobacter sp. Igbk 16]